MVPGLAHGTPGGAISMASDSFLRILWESATTCPPDVRRTLPTIVFVLYIAVLFIGFLIARLGLSQLNPSWFILFTYNGFGTLVILVCAVWCIDFLWLCWLFAAGKKGEATNWWWRNNLLRMDEERQKSEESPEGMEMASGHDEDATKRSKQDDDTDSKSAELNQERRSARIRTILILVTYIWWTTWSLGKKIPFQFIPVSFIVML
eukprot:scaffold8124_cov101-Cylindrotheca_fusiformis.AAC.2